jgi:hypothetical protein
MAAISTGGWNSGEIKRILETTPVHYHGDFLQEFDGTITPNPPLPTPIDDWVKQWLKRGKTHEMGKKQRA